jgi:hypothetical protein
VLPTPSLVRSAHSLGAVSSEERVPVEQVMTGMTLHPLPAGWTPVEALVLVKCLDERGHPSWVYRTTAVPNREELLGALVVQVDLLRKELVAAWED